MGGKALYFSSIFLSDGQRTIPFGRETLQGVAKRTFAPYVKFFIWCKDRGVRNPRLPFESGKKIRVFSSCSCTSERNHIWSECTIGNPPKNLPAKGDGPTTNRRKASTEIRSKKSHLHVFRLQADFSSIFLSDCHRTVPFRRETLQGVAKRTFVPYVKIFPWCEDRGSGTLDYPLRAEKKFEFFFQLRHQ